MRRDYEKHIFHRTFVHHHIWGVSIYPHVIHFYTQIQLISRSSTYGKPLVWLDMGQSLAAAHILLRK